MYDGFMVFTEYLESWKVHLVRNLLEENGIRVILDNSNMSDMFSIPVFAQKILIPEGDYQQALELLEKNKISDELDNVEFDEFAEHTSLQTPETLIEDDYALAETRSKVLAKPIPSEEYHDYNIDLSDEAVKIKDIQSDSQHPAGKTLSDSDTESEYDPSKTYLCPNCKNVYLKKVRMILGLIVLFTFNYILVVMHIVSRIFTSGEITFHEKFGFLLYVNAALFLFHIYTLFRLKFRCDKCEHTEMHFFF